MCNRGGYQPKGDGLNHGNPPRLPDGRPLYNPEPVSVEISTTQKEFVGCNDCIYWKKLPKDDTPKCRRHAPRPVINSSFMDTRQTVVWPLTALTDGCFEGDKKLPAVEEYSLIQNGKEVLKIPVHRNYQKLEDVAEATETEKEEEIPHDEE